VIRTQISLTEDQARRIKREAKIRGVSMSTVVREAVDRMIPSDEAEHRRRVERALALAGKYHSGLTDVSERHDDYLVEAFGDG
jgi:hypothetical protein